MCTHMHSYKIWPGSTYEGVLIAVARRMRLRGGLTRNTAMRNGVCSTKGNFIQIVHYIQYLCLFASSSHRASKLVKQFCRHHFFPAPLSKDTCTYLRNMYFIRKKSVVRNNHRRLWKGNLIPPTEKNVTTISYIFITSYNTAYILTGTYY